MAPLLATADALRRRLPQLRVTALGTETGLEARLVPERGYDLRVVPRVPMPRRPDASALRFPAALRTAVEAAGAAIDEVGAQVVVGFGGYVAPPAYLAARRRGIPIVVHEANARAGFANRLGARLTRFVATTFPSTRLAHARCLGMPLRREITTLHRATRRVEALQAFGLLPDRPTVLVTGGSLGAQRLNQAFAARSRALGDAGIQVLHATGAGKAFDAEQGRAAYVVVPYVDRMELAYAAADLVVCRAGAGTVCEVSAVGLPAVFVPLPIGNGEQRLNAADLADAGGALLVPDAELTPEWIDTELVPLAGSAERLRQMAAAAARFGRRDADEALVDLVVEAFQAGRPGRPGRPGRSGEPPA